MIFQLPGEGQRSAVREAAACVLPWPQWRSPRDAPWKIDDFLSYFLAIDLHL